MVAGEATDPLPYTSITQLGGWPLELAPYCCVQLTPPPPKKRAWTLAVWRVNKAPAGLRPTPGADDAAKQYTIPEDRASSGDESESEEEDAPVGAARAQPRAAGPPFPAPGSLLPAADRRPRSS